MVSSMVCTPCFGKPVTCPACRVNTKMASKRASGHTGIATALLSGKSTSQTTKRLSLEFHRLGSAALSCDDVEQLVGPERRERVSHQSWCGKGCVKWRRPVNSDVRRLAMSSVQAPPSLDDFRNTCRAAFGFTSGYGFYEVPAQRTANAFQVWFRRGDEFIIVEGEGWGTIAATSLEHISGLRLALIYLVPAAARPPKWKRGKRQLNQLEQICQDAAWLQLHGEDFLCGNLDRFLQLAKPLPTWLQKISEVV